MIEPSITVKVLTKSTRLDIDKPSAATHGSFPGKIPVWGSCRFVFGNEQDYDWLVVYDDFNGEIKLNCPKNNTLLVTTDPPLLRLTSQFILASSGMFSRGKKIGH